MSDVSTESKIKFSCRHDIDPRDCRECWLDERAAMLTRDDYAVYVSADRKSVTTFGGWNLGTITRYSEGARQYMPNGGSYVPRYIRVTDRVGQTWHGHGSAEWDLIGLRRTAESKRAARRAEQWLNGN
jgi:hypothetical protein